MIPRMGKSADGIRHKHVVERDVCDSDVEAIENGIEVSPISYLGTSAFVIGFLVEKGHLKVRRDTNGVPHFMKSDMDRFLLKVRKRSAEIARNRS